MNADSNQKIYHALQELKLIKPADLESCYQESQTTQVLIAESVLERGLLNEEAVGEIVADVLGVPYVTLDQVTVDKQVLQLIPETVARAQHTIAYQRENEVINVAQSDITNTSIVKFLQQKTGATVVVKYSPEFVLRRIYTQYGTSLNAALQHLLPPTLSAQSHQELPIISVVSTIIDFAYSSRASDIHIEPQEKVTLVRYRVDGILQDVVTLPKELAPMIVTRIKVMADLHTDEHSEAQDGKIQYQTAEEKLDIRVSVVPITTGEKIVMRLLSENSRQFTLTELGLSDQELAKVTQIASEPTGMILATGPTGSGKTTTLYALLKLLNKREINIMTIEDPVEYQIDNVNQIQVNPKADITFAKGLRSIVRQDPNVILVGEVRDTETAEIAVNAAMTGHLVLSSLHTNDAATTFPRIIDMGVEPYLVASTVKVIIAQRLVRSICPNCKVSQQIDLTEMNEETSAVAKSHQLKTVYVGKGCDVCRHTGYLGRIGIFEVIYMTDDLQHAIMSKSNAGELKKIAQAAGMTTMLDDGITKVKEGITTLDELLRVVAE